MKYISNFEFSEMQLSHVLIDLSNERELSKYLSLFEKCFGKRVNINKELFNWFNFGQPDSQNYNFGFLLGNELVAAYGLLPVDVRINGHIIKAALCTNVMTDPSYSGKGLFARIGELSIDFMKNKGVNLCIGIPNENAIKGHLKIGWNKLDSIDFFEISKDSYLNLYKVDTRIKLVEAFNFKDYEFDVFYEDKFDLHLIRNSKWINWRTSKPNSVYRKFCLFNDDILKGYIILKEYYDEALAIQKLHIVDYLYSSITDFEPLIEHALNYAKTNNFDLVNVWNFSASQEKTSILNKLGLKKSGNSNYVILYPLSDNVEIRNLKSINLTLFDNDVY